jgi:hypothetical protein
VTEDEGSRSSQPIALVEWRYSGLFSMPLRIVWGNASRCHRQQGENISPQLLFWKSTLFWRIRILLLILSCSPPCSTGTGYEPGSTGSPETALKKVLKPF